MLFNMTRVLTVLTFLISSPVFAQQFPQQIPVTISENVIYVKVHINGRGPYNFMLDSGASGIGRIDTRLAKELGLNVVGFEENSDGTTVKREFLAGIGKLSIGPVTYVNLKLVVKDYNSKPKQIPINGIIGRDFFDNYLLTIDGPGRQLILSQGALTAQEKGVLAYQKAFLVSGKVGQTNMLFNLDTGSDIALQFPKSSLSGSHYVNTPNQRVINKTNTTFVLQEAVLNDELVLGSVRVKDLTMYYSDKAHQINVGEAFLKDHIITFDQRRKLVRIE